MFIVGVENCIKSTCFCVKKLFLKIYFYNMMTNEINKFLNLFSKYQNVYRIHWNGVQNIIFEILLQFSAH